MTLSLDTNSARAQLGVGFQLGMYVRVSFSGVLVTAIRPHATRLLMAA